MKKLLALLTVLLCCVNVQAQNIEGQIIASQYGKWRVPGYAPNTYSSFAPSSCRVQGGASFFFAFTVGTPIAIVDANPGLTETVMPTATVDSNVSCAVTIAPINDHQVPFYLTSATGGLQEALNENFTTPQANTVILDSTFYELVGGPANAAAVIAAAQGSVKLGLMDVTQVPTAWYQWNGTQYVKVSIIGSAGNLNTRQADIVTNNQTNNAAVDEDIYVANSPTAGASVYTAQQAITAAAAHNGSIVLQPGAKRAPFTNPGNYRVQDNRVDVPATARNVVEDGAQCDAREVYGTLTQGSTAFTIQNGALTSDDIGRSIVAAITTASPPTQFESVVVSITDSLHGVLTTAAPATMSTYHEMDLGHDDTANIAHTMNVVGSGGTLVFPAGKCMTHTQSLQGQSPIGLGFMSQVVGMPGEDIFAAPDPSQTQGVNQGVAHIHDLSLFPDGRIDATQPWQKCNDSGCTAQTPFYRPVATLSGVAADPLAPGWMVGASNGVATIADGSAVMCVPNAETPPSVGQTVIFPYLTNIYTSTVASTVGSCASGFTPRTLNANLPTGSANAQAEWFAGSSVQNLASPIGSGSCPTSITLANNINPVAGWESNVPPFGLIQIDGEQFSYFGRSNAGNTSPANTLYGIQCAQNGTSRAAHSATATVFPLNRFKPAYPWPVVPSINPGDTTPAGTAGYYPGWNVGNSVFAFPMATGPRIGTGGWSGNSHIENLNFWIWPNEINGVNPSEVNNTAALYFVTPHYATTFSNLYGLGTFYGIANGAPSLENHGYATAQPTGDGTHWDGLQIYAANPVILSAGNQNSFANFNVYSEEQTTSGAALGADTCFYFTHLADDQTGSYFTVLSLDHFKNLYCEPEVGPHGDEMPLWEWDSYNSEIEDQHMGGGGEVYIGGAQQHWFGGNFNNAIQTPAIVFGSQNTASGVTILGSEPKGNVYSANTLINFGYGNDFSGTTAQSFGSPTGPYGGVQVGGRQAIPNQTADTFFTGNVTAPYTSLDGGLVTPEEFNANFSFESAAMSVGYTFDDTSPITHSYAACNVGNNPGTYYCFTSAFNQQKIGVGPGQRITNGKYTMYLSVKDVTAATNTWRFSVGTTCDGIIGTFNIPITNAWPTTFAGVFSAPVDFTGVTTAGCGLGLIFQGATTADQIQIGYIDFAPVAESLNAQTINVTTINLPGGGSTSGGNANGCMQSPVLGISNGYICPTKGFLGNLNANQGISDNTAVLNNTTGFPAASCFFVDTEYECYTAISGLTLTGVTRGLYGSAAATHNSGASVVSAQIVFGPTNQLPFALMAFGGVAPPLFALNNHFPQNRNNGSVSSVLTMNSGSNETWVDTAGTIHQQNNTAANQLGPTAIGFNTLPFESPLAASGYLLQANVPNSAYSPQTFGGGHAGSFNVIQTPNIGAPSTQGALPSGASTVSWVCSGTDFDGNLIPGTTLTLTGVAATWAFPQGISVGCPWAAGINTYQIYRTAGGGSQGLIASGVGPGFWISDFGGAATAGSPPVSNASNPHISVAGTGNPTITMGTVQILNGAGVPSGCGSTYGNGSIYSNTSGSHGANDLLYVCDAATTTWVDIE